MWGQPLMAFEGNSMVCVSDKQGEGRAQGRVCQGEGAAIAKALRPSSHRAPREKAAEEEAPWSKQGVGRAYQGAWGAGELRKAW